MFTRLPYYRHREAFQQAEDRESVTSTELDALLPDQWLEQNPRHTYTWTIDQIRRQERQSRTA